MDRLYLWLHTKSDGHGLVTGSSGWITTWHCGDMTRMALDMYTILPAPPTINSSLVDGQVLPAPPTINSSLVDWQAQDAISAPRR